jgi:hypothetical protein
VFIQVAIVVFSSRTSWSHCGESYQVASRVDKSFGAADQSLREVAPAVYKIPKRGSRSAVGIVEEAVKEERKGAAPWTSNLPTTLPRRSEHGKTARYKMSSEDLRLSVYSQKEVT